MSKRKFKYKLSNEHNFIQQKEDSIDSDFKKQSKKEIKIPKIKLTYHCKSSVTSFDVKGKNTNNPKSNFIILRNPSNQRFLLQDNTLLRQNEKSELSQSSIYKTAQDQQSISLKYIINPNKIYLSEIDNYGSIANTYENKRKLKKDVSKKNKRRKTLVANSTNNSNNNIELFRKKRKNGLLNRIANNISQKIEIKKNNDIENNFSGNSKSLKNNKSDGNLFPQIQLNIKNNTIMNSKIRKNEYLKFLETKLIDLRANFILNNIEGYRGIKQILRKEYNPFKV